MRKSQTITITVVARMTPGETVWDRTVKGFFVRCQAEAKVYGLRRRIDGRARWLTIGKHGSPWTPDTARQKALEMLGAVARGENPAAVRDFERGLPTVKEAAELLLKQHIIPKRKPSTAVGYEICFRRHIYPTLGAMRIDRLTSSDIEQVHASLSDVPGQANRVVAVLSRLMTWAERKKWRDPNTNPVKGLERYKERVRERFLSTEEFGRLGEALVWAEQQGESPFAIAALRLLILTGCRKSEILTARWDFVDLERGLLLLPDSKTGKKAVILNTAAREILATLARIKGNPHVIAGERDGGHLIGLHRIWDRIRQHAQLGDLRVHDLRHSFASVVAAQGASLPMIGKLLGHSVPSTTQRYAHLAQDPLRDLADNAGAHIASVLTRSGPVRRTS